MQNLRENNTNTGMEKHISVLWEPVPLGKRRAPNRLAAQAMETNAAAPGGGVSPFVEERYRLLARGGWGLVFVEAISISGAHLARKNGLVLSRETLPGFRRLVDAFREENPDALVIFQLSHPGRLSGPFSRPVGAYDDGNGLPVLSEGELDAVAVQFLEAVHLSREAGADGVDIKACHGYLGSEIMRPGNRRPDRYGGSAENRVRLIASVVAETVRAYPSFITGSRVSFYEGVLGGCGTAGPGEVMEDPADMLEMLGHIVDAGAHFINVSAGVPAVTPLLTRPQSNNSFDMFHHFRYARLVKERFPGVTVIGSAYSVGREKAVHYAARNIERGYADMAGFGRQSLADPRFPSLLIEAPGEIRYCSLCGGCSRLLRGQERVKCVVYPEGGVRP